MSVNLVINAADPDCSMGRSYQLRTWVVIKCTIIISMYSSSATVLSRT